MPPTSTTNTQSPTIQTGASRQSINKELKELQKINLLEIDNKKLIVLDMARLEALSRAK